MECVDGGVAERRLQRAKPGVRHRSGPNQQTGPPLPSGRMSVQWAMGQAVLYAVALLLAWPLRNADGPECFVLVCLAALFTVAYSVPPLRTKRYGWRANLTIAIPEGGSSEGGRMVHRRSGLLRRNRGSSADFSSYSFWERAPPRITQTSKAMKKAESGTCPFEWVGERPMRRLSPSTCCLGS